MRGTYTADEVDVVAAYCSAADRCYAIPLADFPMLGCLSLRTEPSKNNQELGIKWAKKYELGAIAQLGERRHGMAEAVGSSPTSSTPKSRPPGRLF